MGGELAVDCSTPCGTRAGSAATLPLPLPFSSLSLTVLQNLKLWLFLASEENFGSFRGLQRQGACEGMVAVVPKAVTLLGQKVSKALRMYGDLPPK